MQWKDPQMLKRYTHNEAWEEQAIVDDLSFSSLDKFINRPCKRFDLATN